MLTCSKCGKAIPPARIEAFLDAGRELPDTCVDCSTEVPHFGVMVYPHKTGGDTLIINNATPEQIRQAKRFIRRAR